MRNLLEVGRRSAWGTVDTGYDSGSKSEGGLVLGDFGFGYGLMDGITVRLQVVQRIPIRISTTVAISRPTAGMSRPKSPPICLVIFI